MQMQHKVELIKKLDQHECVLSCTNGCPLDFILVCLNDFIAYVQQKKSEQESSNNCSEKKCEE